jgi:hypothetical protein
MLQGSTNAVFTGASLPVGNYNVKGGFDYFDIDAWQYLTKSCIVYYAFVLL